MRKSVKALAMLLAATMMFTACGSSTNETAEETNVAGEGTNEAVEVTRGEFNVADFVTIEDYEGLKIAKADVTATEDEIQQEIDNLVQDGVTLKKVKRAAKEGDTVNIDYEGKLDGVAFEGGTATDYDLELGSHSFIDGFEDGLIGVKAGKKVSLNLTFPDPYENNPDLAGKEVVFDVTVNEVKKPVTPEYDDELVKNNTEYKSTTEFEAAVKADLEESKLNTAMNTNILAKAQFAETLPESLVNFYQTRYVEYYDSMFTMYYGMTLEDYLAQIGQTMDDFYSQVGVEDTVKNELVWSYIAEKEGFAAEGEDYDAYLQEQADNYGIEVDEYLEQMTEDEAKFVYCIDKAQKFVMDNLVIE